MKLTISVIILSSAAFLHSAKHKIVCSGSIQRKTCAEWKYPKFAIHPCCLIEHYQSAVSSPWKIAVFTRKANFTMDLSLPCDRYLLRPDLCCLQMLIRACRQSSSCSCKNMYQKHKNKISHHNRFTPFSVALIDLCRTVQINRRISADDSVLAQEGSVNGGKCFAFIHGD